MTFGLGGYASLARIAKALERQAAADERRNELIEAQDVERRRAWEESMAQQQAAIDKITESSNTTTVAQAVALADGITDLPARIVVGANGAYWRDYGSHYSMCPVSEDNDPVGVVAVYVLQR